MPVHEVNSKLGSFWGDGYHEALHHLFTVASGFMNLIPSMMFDDRALIIAVVGENITVLFNGRTFTFAKEWFIEDKDFNPIPGHLMTKKCSVSTELERQK